MQSSMWVGGCKEETSCGEEALQPKSYVGEESGGGGQVSETISSSCKPSLDLSISSMHQSSKTEETFLTSLKFCA